MINITGHCCMLILSCLLSSYVMVATFFEYPAMNSSKLVVCFVVLYILWLLLLLIFWYIAGQWGACWVQLLFWGALCSVCGQETQWSGPVCRSKYKCHTWRALSTRLAKLHYGFPHYTSHDLILLPAVNRKVYYRRYSLPNKTGYNP